LVVAVVFTLAGAAFTVSVLLRGIEALPVSGEWWPRPTEEEIEAANGDRYYYGDTPITLTVKDIGIYDVPIVESNSDEDLDQGVIHLPETPMPWEEREQKNVYLAGHRFGNLDTTGRMIFFNLDQLETGDEVTLEDSSGETYEYEVSEIFVVDPNADWVIDPVRGRDMVTLQTCTYPTGENRIIVRADRA
jgi:sortase A